MKNLMIASGGPRSRSWWARWGKPVADRFGAILLLVLLSPLLLASMILIYASDRGTVFFRQRRAGMGGAPFMLVKFRTMRFDRTPDALERVPLHHPDITRVGWWLRRFKIDEAPQLWNVLRGEMSLVGPRPTLLDQVKAYDDFKRQRLLVRPGMTGLAQVRGNADVSWEQRILFDVAYVRRCNLRLDSWILLRTIGVVLTGGKGPFPDFQDTPFASSIDPREAASCLYP